VLRKLGAPLSPTRVLCSWHLEETEPATHRPSWKPQAKMLPLWAGRCEREEREGLTPNFICWIRPCLPLKKQDLAGDRERGQEC